MINESVFKFFYLNYNGGPEILLNGKEDIYSNYTYSSEKDYYLYSRIKENNNNSNDESNLSDYNSNNENKKLSKIKFTPSVNKNIKYKILNQNFKTQFNKDLCEKNEWNEIEIFKDFDLENFESENKKISLVDESKNNIDFFETNYNINNDRIGQINSINSKPNFEIFHPNHINSKKSNKILINLKIHQNSSNIINDDSTNQKDSMSTNFLINRHLMQNEK